jgi:hypothetical protein
MQQPSFWLDQPSRALRIIRLLWVLATTGLLVRLMFASYFGEPFNRGAQSPELWASFLLKVAVPASGAILEILGSKYAKWCMLASGPSLACTTAQGPHSTSLMLISEFY